MRRCLLAAVVAVLATVAGCGPAPVPVEGKVVWADGAAAKELAGSVVQFEATATKARGRGAIVQDGTFRLAAEPDGGGLPPGEYRVWIAETRDVVRETDQGAELAPPRMDPRFENPDSSGLTATVRGGESITLTVARAATGKKR